MTSKYPDQAREVFRKFRLSDRINCILRDLRDRSTRGPDPKRQWQTESNQPIVVVGPSRAGKDTVSLLLSRLTHHRYGGSCSVNSAQLVMSGWNMVHPLDHFDDIVDFFGSRHSRKMFWFDFLNSIRDICTTTVSALALDHHSDILTGVRSLSELEAIRPYIETCIWVQNSRVPDDPTLEFDADDCRRLFGSNCVIMNNDGSTRELLDKFLNLMPLLPVEFQIIPRGMPQWTDDHLPIGG